MATSTDRTDERLTELEIKASFTEDLLDTLNRIVAEQAQQIDALRREIHDLRQQATQDNPPAFRSLRDELPPHY